MIIELKDKIHQKASEHAKTWECYKGANAVMVSYGEFVIGAEWLYEQMTEDAVDGICISSGTECGSVIESSAGTLFLQRDKLTVGDKVKLIIIKEG